MGFLLKTFGLTCKDTSPLISEMMDHSLPPLKRWKIKIHLAMCEVCRYYKQQLDILRSLARGLQLEDTPALFNITLSTAAKDRIKSLIQARESGDSSQ